MQKRSVGFITSRLADFSTLESVTNSFITNIFIEGFIWYDFGASIGFNLTCKLCMYIRTAVVLLVVIWCYHYYYYYLAVDFDSVLVPATAYNYLHYGNYCSACVLGSASVIWLHS